jgi:hypothetical protein
MAEEIRNTRIEQGDPEVVPVEIEGPDTEADPEVALEEIAGTDIEADPEVVPEEKERPDAESGPDIPPEEVTAQDLNLVWVKAPPAEVGVGVAMELILGISCPVACDLEGTLVRIMGKDSIVTDGLELTKVDEMTYKTGEVFVKTPLEPGDYTWTAIFPQQEKEGVLYQESLAPFQFVAKAHSVGLEIWDIPSPIVMGTPFSAKVGVKCLDKCSLTGRRVEVFDHYGENVATALLADAPYSDQIDLHWSEIQLVSPDEKGYFRWEAKFPVSDLELLHEEASRTFVISTVEPLECEVAVEVINKELNAPIENAQVVIRPKLYRGSTDKNGIVKIRITKGEYVLRVTAHERAPKGIKYMHGCVPSVTTGREDWIYIPEANVDTKEPFWTTINVDGDVTIKVELVGVIEHPDSDTY